MNTFILKLVTYFAQPMAVERRIAPGAAVKAAPATAPNSGSERAQCSTRKE